jgi:glycosyltransferase involved in cell wall biosynthesis
MEDRRARVSIGVPVYNGERFLRATVESLITQTFGDFEIIIADNASTDDTEQIGRELASCDSRVRYHRHSHNLGLSGNYNFLVRNSTGAYFKWAPCDDPCLPTFIERCTDVLDADAGVVLVYPRARFVDDRLQPLPLQDPGFPLDFDPPAERLRYVIGAGHWVNAILGLIRRDALMRTRLLPPYPGGDYALLGELCLQGRFVEIPDELLLRRIHPGASSQLGGDPERLVRYWTGRSGASLPGFSRLAGHARTVLVSSLGAHQKLSLLREVFRQAHLGRQRLEREIIVAARVALRPRRPSGPA